jgi:hypothetical protein
MPDNKFNRDASGRLTYEMFRVPSSEYAAVCIFVVAAFSLEAHSTMVVGPDQMFWDFRRGEQVVELGWDNWSGVVVTAKNPNAEPLIREIGEFLEASSWTEIGQETTESTDGASS